MPISVKPIRAGAAALAVVAAALSALPVHAAGWGASSYQYAFNDPASGAAPGVPPGAAQQGPAALAPAKPTETRVGGWGASVYQYADGTSPASGAAAPAMAAPKPLPKPAR